MKGLNEIANFFKSVQGIITCVIAVGAVGSSVLLRHDAKVRNEFVKNNKTINILSVDSVFKLRMNPVTSRLNNISDSIKKDFDDRNVFQDNYSRLIWEKFGNEWMKYMNGMSITVIQSEMQSNKSYDVKPELKIRIEKIKK